MLLNALGKEVNSLISRPLIRHGSRKIKHKVPEKIPVQLLKDHPAVGLQGEIVRVRPAFMRNYLHRDNGACYLTKDQGPRIPVTEKSRQKERKPAVEAKIDNKIVEQVESQKDDGNTGAMSLDELSNLFNTMKTSRRTKQGAEADELKQAFEASTQEIAYTASELQQAIPRVHTVLLNDTVKLPIDKSYVASLIYDMAGVQIPHASIKLSTLANSRALLNEITTVGDYTMTLEVPGDRNGVQRTLRVQ